MTQPRLSQGLRLLVNQPRAEAAEWRRLQENNDAGARTALFQRYREFAQKTAKGQYKRISDMGLELSDCEQLAYEALLQSIQRFEPGRGRPFTAFARPRIQGAIHNGLAKASEARAAYSARNRAERDRLASLKRQAEETGTNDTIEHLREIIVGLALGFMLEENAETEARKVSSDNPSAYDHVAWAQTLKAMRSKLATLPDREHKVIDLHYNHGLGFAEIATLLGLSRGRISQVHASALARLRKSLAKYR